MTPSGWTGDLRGPRLERVVDGRAQLLARDEVDGDRRSDDGERDGGGGGDRDASPEAQRQPSRSA